MTPSPRSVRVCRAALRLLQLRDRAPATLRYLRLSVVDYCRSPYRSTGARAYLLVSGIEGSIRYLLQGEYTSPATEQADKG